MWLYSYFCCLDFLLDIDLHFSDLIFWMNWSYCLEFPCMDNNNDLMIYAFAFLLGLKFFSISHYNPKSNVKLSSMALASLCLEGIAVVFTVLDEFVSL